MFTPAGWAAVDLGRSYTRIQFGDLSEWRSDVHRVPTAELPGQGGLPAWVDQIKRQTRVGALQAVVIGAPGPLNEKTGELSAPNLPAGLERPLVSWCREQFGEGIAIQIGKDASFAAYGEYKQGVGRRHPEVKNLFLVIAGSGIGGGVVLEGRLSPLLGEIGHTIYAPASPLDCACGNKGCVELFCGGENVASRYGLPIEEIVARARSERQASDWLCEIGTALGTVIGNAAMILPADTQVVVGGGSAASWEYLGPIVEDAAQNKFLQASRQATGLSPRLTIVPSELELSPGPSTPGLVGAAELARELTAR
jgi:predicted NBD/HSP70 family sugar kinase